MVFGFGLLLIAALMLDAGITGRGIGEVIRGEIGRGFALADISFPDFQTQDPGGGSGGTATASFVTGGGGVGTFDGKPVANWIIPELQYARAHGWTGHVTSGYRSLADQTRIYNSGVRPAAKPGTSNHEGSEFPRGAVDVTQASQLSRILKAKGSPLVWAGTRDPVHFSHPHGGSY